MDDLEESGWFLNDAEGMRWRESGRKEDKIDG